MGFSLSSVLLVLLLVFSASFGGGTTPTLAARGQHFLQATSASGWQPCNLFEEIASVQLEVDAVANTSSSSASASASTSTTPPVASQRTQCALIIAPLCYDGICQDDRFRTVQLFVKRILAANSSNSSASASPANGVNVWLLGPLQPAGDEIEATAQQLYYQLDGKANVYMMHPRGTGKSTPFDCIAAQSTTAGSPGMQQVTLDEVSACASDLVDMFGPSLASFSIASIAKDLAVFMQTFLASAKVFVYGFGAGTLATQALMQLQVPQIRGFVLDNLVAPSVTDRDADFGSVAEVFFGRCMDDPQCAPHFQQKPIDQQLQQLLEAMDHPSTNSSIAPCLESFSNYLQRQQTDGSSIDGSYSFRRFLAMKFTSSSSSATSEIPVLVARMANCRERDRRVLRVYFENQKAMTTSDPKLFVDFLTFAERWPTPSPSKESLQQSFVAASMSDGAVFTRVDKMCAFTRRNDPVCNATALRSSARETPALSYDKRPFWKPGGLNSLSGSLPSVLCIQSEMNPYTNVRHAQTLLANLSSSHSLVQIPSMTSRASSLLAAATGSNTAAANCAKIIIGSFVKALGNLDAVNSSCVDQLADAASTFKFDVPALQSVALFGTSDAFDGDSNSLANDTDKNKRDDPLNSTANARSNWSSSTIWVIVLGCASGLTLILIIVLMCRLRRLEKLRREENQLRMLQEVSEYDVVSKIMSDYSQ